MTNNTAIVDTPNLESKQHMLVDLLNNSTFSIPKPRKSLGAAVIAIEKPVRAAVFALIERYSCEYESEIYSRVFSNRYYGQGASEEDISVRLSWLVVAATILHAISQRRATANCFESSLLWFFGSKDLTNKVLGCFQESFVAQDHLTELAITEETYALLPYIMEPHGHVTRSKKENCQNAKKIRNTKKISGVYYTPSDVSDFIVNKVSELSREKNGTWLDPACGTGVFIRSIIKNIRQENSAFPVSQIQNIIQGKVYGVDKSALAVDIASLIFALDISLFNNSNTPFYYWQRIQKNFLCMDALALPSLAFDLDEKEPSAECAKRFLNEYEKKFSHIVMNPPYSNIKIDSSLKANWHSYQTSSIGSKGDTQLAFSELLFRAVTPAGASGAVLPLSIAVNTQGQYKSFRSVLAEHGGTKEFLFFDREPQALFGEDVKTRNTITFFHSFAEAHQVRVSSFKKWRAVTRSSIFDRDDLTSVTGLDIKNFVPKLSCSHESMVYRQMKSGINLRSEEHFRIRKIGIPELIRTTEASDERNVIVSATAYNFINTFFGSSLPNDASIPYSSSPVNVLEARSIDDAYAIFALLSSRVSFWHWRVEGDGFHLNTTFLKSLPFWGILSDAELRAQLIQSGKELWKKTKINMSKSNNGGKITFSFKPNHFANEIDDIDRSIFKFFKLDEGSMKFLTKFIDTTRL